MKQILFIMLVIIGFFTIAGCGGSSDSGDGEQKKFYAETIELMYSDKPCYSHYAGLGYNESEITETCGTTIIPNDGLLQFDHTYHRVQIYVTNNDENTDIVRFMITRDDGMIVVDEYGDDSNIISEFTGINGDKISIYILPFFYELFDDDRGHIFTIDYWAIDMNGVESSLSSFEIKATPLAS